MVKIILYGLTFITDKILEMCKTEVLNGKIEFLIASSLPSFQEVCGVKVVQEEEAFRLPYDYVIICEDEYEPQKLEKYGVKEEQYIHPNVIIENVCFDFCKYLELRKRNISIICDTNWGREVCHSLYINYNTPFIDVRIEPEAYLKLISNVSYYIECPLEIVSDRTIKDCPKGRLGDLIISFPSELTFEDARIHWHNRTLKFNKEDYIVVMCGAVNEKQLEKFLDLKLENGFAFYFENYNNDHVISFKEWDSQIIRKKFRWFPFYLNRTAYRKFDGIKQYRILDLLLGNDFKRECV